MDELYFATSNKRQNSTKEQEQEFNDIIDFDEMNIEQIQKIINQEIDRNKLKELEAEIQLRILKKDPKNINRGLANFKKHVNNCIETVKTDYKAPIKKWVERDFMTLQPFQKKYSKKFFLALKLNYTQSVLNYLEMNPYLIYDVNNV